jgi:hypothetical protein
MSNDKKNPDKLPRRMVLPDGTIFNPVGIVVTSAPPPIKPMGNSATVRKQQAVATVPNWREWGNMPNVEVWQACALSLNINPRSLEQCEDWESDTRDGYPYFRDASFPSKTISEEFYLRRRVLIANLRKNPEWFTYNSLSAAGNSSLSTAEFAAWAVSKMQWPDLPDKLVELARKPTAAPEQNDVQAPASNIAPAKVGTVDSPIPGKLPNISVGKLAIEVAWLLEQETHRAATAQEVMKQLQAWADDGSKPEVLLKSAKAKHGVEWRTKGGKPKIYDSEACGKALATWMKSRA